MIALVLAAVLGLSSPAPSPVGQTSFNDYLEVAIDCGESMKNQNIDGVINCSLELDAIVPMECYAISWSYFRVATNLIVESIMTGRSDFSPAIQYLVDEFVEIAKQTGEDCSPYYVGENET